ncbi:microtubule-associated protein RP/EB family member 1A-like [Lolium perenne]|uniref:microtubule-associated protein RP/EB family member 1A-like n=1 Tax=Lolium perenne TaxID=4522 RepID=UPI003A999D02
MRPATSLHSRLLDMVYPGVVKIRKVNFDAKTERDMIHDYKVPSDVFNKLHITEISKERAERGDKPRAARERQQIIKSNCMLQMLQISIDLYVGP